MYIGQTYRGKLTGLGDAISPRPFPYNRPQSRDKPPGPGLSGSRPAGAGRNTRPGRQPSIYLLWDRPENWKEALRRAG